MSEANLVELIRWMRSGKRPHYVLLPKSEYLTKWQAWGLPSPEAATDLLASK